MFNCFLSLFVSVQFSDAHVNVLSVVVFFGLNKCLVKNKGGTLLFGDPLSELWHSILTVTVF